MQDFDFLRNHGYSVVYGEKAVRQKIFELGSTEPNKGKNMNEITNANTDAPFDLGLIEILDEEGNPTGQYKARDGEAAQAGITFVTAEDGDHEVTTIH